MKGWIEPHGTGYRLRIRDHAGKKKTLGTFDDRGTAERMLGALRAEVADGLVADPGTLTFGQFGEEWLDRRELNGSDRRARVRGIDQERSVWRAHVAGAEWYDAPIHSIRPVDVMDWLKRLARKEAVRPIKTREGVVYRPTGKRLGRGVLVKALRLARQSLDDAVLRDLIRANPAAAVKVPASARAGRAEEEWTYLTAAELGMLEGAEMPRDRQLLFLATVYTGMRRGEVFALQWRDVDLDLHRLTVCRSLDAGTKGGAVRRCPLLPMATAVLTEWRDLAKARGLKTEGTALVFPRPGGGQYGRSYTAGWSDKVDRTKGKAADGHVRTGWATRIGIVRHVHFHDLRHTCASHLVMGTWGRAWSLQEVRDFMGHSNVSETQRYAHLAPEVLDDAAKKTNGLPPFAPKPPGGGKKKPLESIMIQGAFGGASSRARTVDPRLVRAMRCLHDLADLDPPGGHLGGSSPPDVVRALLEDAAEAEAMAMELALGEVLRALGERRPRAALAALAHAGDPRWRSRVLDLLELLDVDVPAGAKGDGDVG